MYPDALSQPVKASAEEALNFTNLFYKALNDGKPISSFYVTNNPTYRAAGHKPADICINGAVLATPEEYDTLLTSQRTSTSTTRPGASSAVRHDVDAVDAHVLNPDYRFAAPAALLAPNPSKPAHVRLMILVCVSGTLVLGADGHHQEKRRFSDNFVLVPNWDAIARHGSKATRRFLIASEQYRCD